MRRSIYIIFPILVLASMLLSGFGVAPKNTWLSANTTSTPTLISGLSTPVQTPQSAIFGSCSSIGEGVVVTDFAKDLKGIAIKDYADYMSPESLARYVAIHKDYLKTLDPEQLVKYAAGLSTKDRESYLATLTSAARAKFEAALAEYQQGELYQNELKNRTDSPGAYKSDYKSMKFQDLLDLPPTAANIRSQLASNSHWKNRGTWEKWQKDLIYRYEGLAIKVDGYIYSTEPQDAETTNCGLSAPDMVDWHVVFMGTKDQHDRGKAVVVELTPRIRDLHKEWTLDLMKFIRNRYRIRISGWLFFDPEHSGNLPGNKNVSRGTLWEIHPVMRIFIKLQDDNTSPWYPLENCSIDTHKTTGKADATLTCTKPDSSEAP